MTELIEQPQPDTEIIFDTTFSHTITGFGFGNLSEEIMVETFKDGRAFSHFIEPWLAINYPCLKHIKGCKKYDYTDTTDENIKYDQKTFTQRGCNFLPSNMIGEGRKFDAEIFKEKAKNLIYIVVSNVDFPRIKVRFVRGTRLIIDYPNGKIPLKDFVKFFN